MSGRDAVEVAAAGPGPGQTDRRDAAHLARLLRLGEVTAVNVPGVEQEAARDLVRARDDGRRDLSSARRRRSKLLLRQGAVYSGGKAWTGPHEQWLPGQRRDPPALSQLPGLGLVFTAGLAPVPACTGFLRDWDRSLPVTVKAWWHTSFARPEPKSTSMRIFDGPLDAGSRTPSRFRIPYRPKHPSSASPSVRPLLPSSHASSTDHENWCRRINTSHL